MSEPTVQSLLKGCDHVYSDVELKHKLDKAAWKRPLRIKLGMDRPPRTFTSATACRSENAQFQDWATRACSSSATSPSIGDPTGRSKTRPMLTPEEIDANAPGLHRPGRHILDMSPKSSKCGGTPSGWGRCTSTTWFGSRPRATLGQLDEREDFRKRYESEEAISLHELLYPLVQGWDSVNIQSDVELGGTDQMYNNLVGRDLQTSVGGSHRS